jgi:hypothetical protein
MRSILHPILVCALLSGCVEFPIYTHPQSKELRATRDLDAPSLAPFRHDGVVVGVGMVQGHANVAVRLYGKEAATVTVDELRIAGLGTRADLEVEVKPAKTVELIASQADPAFFAQGLTVFFPAPDVGVDAMGEEGFVVTITWHVGDGRATQTELTLQRKMTRDIAWPT